jgi:hypothetical protein
VQLKCISLSYIVDYTRRTVVKDRLFTKIVNEVVNSDGRLEWAASNRFVVRSDAVEFPRTGKFALMRT